MMTLHKGVKILTFLFKNCFSASQCESRRTNRQRLKPFSAVFTPNVELSIFFTLPTSHENEGRCGVNDAEYSMCLLQAHSKENDVCSIGWNSIIHEGFFGDNLLVLCLIYLNL